MTTKTIDRAQIANIPKVPFTKTWRPQHHSLILDTIDAQLKSIGLQPISETLQVSADGKDMFGVMGIQTSNHDDPSRSVVQSLGFRNSMKKNFSLGFVAGSNVMVCSNMQFYGDFEEFLRHDSTMTTQAIQDFTATAIDTIRDKHGVYRAWFDRLVDTEMSFPQFKESTYDIMMAGIINPKDFSNFLGDYRDELAAQPYYPAEETFGRFHGAVTRNLRKHSTRQQMDRTRKLNDYLEIFVPKADQVVDYDDCLI